MSRRTRSVVLFVVLAFAATACDGVIAYADKVGIHVINPDGTGKRTIVPSWGARYPRWSPDGQLLVYEQRDRNSNRGNVPVRLVNPDGSGMRTLFTGYGPQWAPDGKSIVYGVMGNPTRIFRYDLASRRSTELGVSPLPAKARLADFALSDDGTRLIWFEDNDTLEASVPGSTLVDAKLDGTGRRQRFADTYYDGAPDPWPDGRVAYSCRAMDTWSSDVCVMRLSTNRVTRMSGPNSVMEVHALLSPSGDRILFGALDRLYITNDRRQGARTLFTVGSPSGNPTNPSWQNAGG